VARGRAAEAVGRDSKPLVDSLVDCVILVADLLFERGFGWFGWLGWAGRVGCGNVLACPRIPSTTPLHSRAMHAAHNTSCCRPGRGVVSALAFRAKSRSPPPLLLPLHLLLLLLRLLLPLLPLSLWEQTHSSSPPPQPPHLLASEPLLQSLGLRGGAVLVGAAHKDGVVAAAGGEGWFC
jgi:hypothetical protein